MHGTNTAKILPLWQVKTKNRALHLRADESGGPHQMP